MSAPASLKRAQARSSTRGASRLSGADTPRKPGRPRQGDHPKIRVTVTLDPVLAEQLRTLGNGNLSRGIEIATRHLTR